MSDPSNCYISQEKQQSDQLRAQRREAVLCFCQPSMLTSSRPSRVGCSWSWPREAAVRGWDCHGPTLTADDSLPMTITPSSRIFALQQPRRWQLSIQHLRSMGMPLGIQTSGCMSAMYLASLHTPLTTWPSTTYPGKSRPGARCSRRLKRLDLQGARHLWFSGAHLLSLGSRQSLITDSQVQLDCKLQIDSAGGQALVMLACFRGERI